MIRSDVTLNVILNNASRRAHVTLAHVRRHTNVTLGSTRPVPTSPPPLATSPRTLRTSPSVKFTVAPTSPPTRPTSPSRPEGGHHCVVSGESCGDVGDQTLASGFKGGSEASPR
jgi:hypothetical protein